MVANVIVSTLCVHLLCFGVMFWLISRQLKTNAMGMDVFAIGCVLLSCAYALQLLAGPSEWGIFSLVDHTLTLLAPVAYVLGAMHFFGRKPAVWYWLGAVALVYTSVQLVVQWQFGLVARYALLSATCAIFFLGMVIATVHGMQTYAKELRIEMAWFALLIAGICIMNFLKLGALLSDGMSALDMGRKLQIAFYLYMSFLAAVLPPSTVWLVMRRLSEALSAAAVRDPLTGMLNRRGLQESLQTYFNTRAACPAYALMVDVDHFKRINDRYGHQTGDLVLCAVAETLHQCIRRGDLVCRLGGEEFAVVCLEADSQGAQLLAQRICSSIEMQRIPLGHAGGAIQCTVTIGVSQSFASLHALDHAIQQADQALYCGKRAGRNRVQVVQADHAAAHHTAEAALPKALPAEVTDVT